MQGWNFRSWWQYSCICKDLTSPEQSWWVFSWAQSYTDTTTLCYLGISIVLSSMSTSLTWLQTKSQHKIPSAFLPSFFSPCRLFLVTSTNHRNAWRQHLQRHFSSHISTKQDWKDALLAILLHHWPQQRSLICFPSARAAEAHCLISKLTGDSSLWCWWTSVNIIFSFPCDALCPSNMSGARPLAPHSCFTSCSSFIFRAWCWGWVQYPRPRDEETSEGAKAGRNMPL